MNRVFLKNVILRLCSQPRSFEYISKNLSGLDPIEAIAVLSELEQENKLVCIDELWTIKEIPVTNTFPFDTHDPHLYLQKYMGYFNFLKNPHPLDYEWRNSSLSLTRLLNRLLTITVASDNILFLGMPTLFATAILKDFPNKVSLIEKNGPIVQGLKKIISDQERFRVIESDIFTINPNQISDFYCVVMDPPWYTPHFRHFMWLASKVTSIGGIVLISLPPINTRPNIIEERLNWFSYCRDLGLCIETLEPQQLQYAMPFFEFNALRAAGVKNILPFWRKGDLAIFRKISEDSIERPFNDNGVVENWQEKEYNKCRIRIKTIDTNSRIPQTDVPEISSLLKGDILPTVSSRDERRKAANIWTSGNRIFSTNDPEGLLRTISLLQKQDPVTDIQQKVKTFIQTISNLENQEFKEYLDWIYYEMERQTD